MQQKLNDLCKHFLDTNERPQNSIKKYKPEERFEDYPKSKELIRLKSELIKKHNHPPNYIKADLRTFDLQQLGKFDVILIDPPWAEYAKRLMQANMQVKEHQQSWTLEELKQLHIDKIADIPSFIFLWCGSEHLDDGRELFKTWGFKRCEDIVWLKTNKDHSKQNQYVAGQDYGDNLFRRVKEHCLVGLRGDVKRASDQHFIHANIDTDVIITEEEVMGSTKKPEELYEIIERFCLGRKRIELFGEIHNIRDGWLTIGSQLRDTRQMPQQYNSYFQQEQFSEEKPFMGPRYLQTTIEIENLRPKSPPKEQQQQQPQTYFY
ncbi:unnamed protein product [Paramecium octaurelia]|uniref:Uncharacterized protein n=1 Tax=Paramecium octaurelia TaxID=43137 RepID=A0A8S1YAE5_PAROT|nr:unnamed protein product [Paramecium octaurelia]